MAGPVTYHNVYADPKGRWRVMSTWPGASREACDRVAERYVSANYKSYRPKRVAVIRVTWRDSLAKYSVLGLPRPEYVEGP